MVADVDSLSITDHIFASLMVTILWQSVPQNLTEHSWIYSHGYLDDMRIYQSEAGFHGQKLVTGTRGTGTVSRSIDAQVYGGLTATMRSSPNGAYSRTGSIQSAYNQ